MAPVRHSLVVPVYRNEESIPALIEAIEGIQSELASPLEAVFVVDGSPDRSYRLLADLLPGAAFPSRLVLLSRNFGSFAAIRTGFEQATGSYLAVMAADLQEPAELILEFFRRLESGTTDVVVGTRTARDDGPFSRAASRAFWALYRRLVMPEIPPGGVDVFGCTDRIVQRLVSLKEARSSLVAQLYWIGFRREEVPYERAKRHSGRSGWTLRKKLNYFTDSVYAFTDLPIRLLTLSGLIGLAVSAVVGSLTLAGRLLEWFTVPGYAPTVILLLFFGSLNLFGLGLVGSYAWRAYENTKQRPEAIPMLVDQFEGR